MDRLRGSAETTVDEKGRFKVPAVFREPDRGDVRAASSSSRRSPAPTSSSTRCRSGTPSRRSSPRCRRFTARRRSSSSASTRSDRRSRMDAQGRLLVPSLLREIVGTRGRRSRPRPDRSPPARRPRRATSRRSRPPRSRMRITTNSHAISSDARPWMERAGPRPRPPPGGRRGAPAGARRRLRRRDARPRRPRGGAPRGRRPTCASSGSTGIRRPSRSRRSASPASATGSSPSRAGTRTSRRHLDAARDCRAWTGVLADLGVSSLQLDRAERGFSFMKDGPLDMRMGRDRADGCRPRRHASREGTGADFPRLGEERMAGRDRPTRSWRRGRRRRSGRRGASASRRSGRSGRRREKHKDPATRVFQALRIATNRELVELERFLDDAIARLSLGARLTVLSYHSLEDRIVKRAFQRHTAGCTLPAVVPGLRLLAPPRHGARHEEARPPVARRARREPARPFGAPPRPRARRGGVAARLRRRAEAPWPTRSAAPSRTSTSSASVTAAGRASSSRSRSPPCRRSSSCSSRSGRTSKTVELGYQLARLAEAAGGARRDEAPARDGARPGGRALAGRGRLASDARPRAPDARPGRAREGRGARSGASARAAARRAPGGALSAAAPPRSLPPGATSSSASSASGSSSSSCGSWTCRSSASDEFVRRAKKQQERTVELAPRRGTIDDADGKPLAVNARADSVFAIPSDVADAGGRGRAPRADPEAARAGAPEEARRPRHASSSGSRAASRTERRPRARARRREAAPGSQRS